MLTLEKNLPTPLVFLGLASICALAIFLRVSNLDGPDFGIDEILHVYASQELMKGNPPLLPGGETYGRALSFTWLVGMAGKIGGLNEGTARVPGVVFGILTVLLVFFMGRYWYSNGVGLLAAFFIAVIPAEIVFSRSVRMYSMFQFLYLLVIALFFYGYESFGKKGKYKDASERNMKFWNALEIRPIALILSGLLFLFTQHIHLLIVPAMSGPLLYIIVMCGVSWWLTEVSWGCKFKYLLSVLLIGLSGLGMYVFNEELFVRYLRFARTVPAWAMDENVGVWQYYRDALALRYPVVFGTFLLGGLIGLAKNPRMTTYLITCFFAPFLLSSFVFSWKAYRYIFHLLPLMFILFSIGFIELGSYLYRVLLQFFQKGLSQPVSRIVTIILITTGIVFWLQGTQWFNQGMRYHRLNVSHVDGVRYNNWQEAMQCVSNHSDPSTVLISPWPLLSQYYGPKRKGYKFNNHIPALDETSFLGAASEISDLESLRTVVRERSSGIFVSDRTRFFHYSRSIPVKVRDWVSKNFHEIDCPSARDMVIWRWNNYGDS